MKDQCYTTRTARTLYELSSRVEIAIHEEGWTPIGGVVIDSQNDITGHPIKVYVQTLYRAPVQEIQLTPEGAKVLEQIENGATVVNGVDCTVIKNMIQENDFSKRRF